MTELLGAMLLTGSKDMQRCRAVSRTALQHQGTNQIAGVNHLSLHGHSQEDIDKKCMPGMMESAGFHRTESVFGMCSRAEEILAHRSSVSC